MKTMIVLKAIARAIFSPSKREDSYYHVSRDGALVLDRDALLGSGKMDSQLEAVRELKKQVETARQNKRTRQCACGSQMGESDRVAPPTVRANARRPGRSR